MASIFTKQAALERNSSHTYTARHHADWMVGPTLQGGCVTGVIHLAAAKHFNTTLREYNQPDVFTLQVEFIRFSEAKDLNISIVDLKRNKTQCLIQVQLAQEGKLRAIALVTSTNFDRSLGPSAKSDWTLHPTPKPAPSFNKIKANEPDDHWIAARVRGEIYPLSRHILTLNSRDGFPQAGVLDAWNGFIDNKMDAACIALMCDFLPSMSDTLMQNGTVFDAHKIFSDISSWEKRNPGAVCELTNTLADAASASTICTTMNLGIQFKKRVPEDGVPWIFTRGTTRMLENGRMDLDVTICDGNMDIVCLASQVFLVIGSGQRLRNKSNAKL